MGEIFSLKVQRKRRARQVKESEAAANRARYGTAKLHRRLIEARRIRENEHLDGHKIEE